MNNEALRRKTVERAGRTFEICVEELAEPGYLEAVIYEGETIASLPYPGGAAVIPTCAVTVAGGGLACTPELMDALIEMAESEIHRRIH